MPRSGLLSILFAIFLLATTTVLAQADYAAAVASAWEAYEAREYLSSARQYNDAFRHNGDLGSSTDRYNAACSWALAGEPDSAFHHLTRIAARGNYTNLGHLTTDKDLATLYDDPRWVTVVERVAANKREAEKDLDQGLVATLDSVFATDQGLRREIAEIEEAFGRDSEEMRAHWREIQRQDSLNLITVRRILDTRGWLGEDVVGGQGNTTLFLVVQHADIETQQHYLPMMREAVAAGRARAANLALLEDRILLREGKPQLYGSQIAMGPDGVAYVDNLADPMRVDERRASVGLGPLAEYVAHWGIEWDPKTYEAGGRE